MTPEQINAEINAGLIGFLQEQGYQNLRVVEGGIIGTIDMLYTRALVIDIDRDGYDHRYCYADKTLADKAAQELTSLDAEPLAGYAAIKGKRV